MEEQPDLRVVLGGEFVWQRSVLQFIQEISVGFFVEAISIGNVGLHNTLLGMLKSPVVSECLYITNEQHSFAVVGRGQRPRRCARLRRESAEALGRAVANKTINRQPRSNDRDHAEHRKRTAWSVNRNGRSGRRARGAAARRATCWRRPTSRKIWRRPWWRACNARVDERRSGCTLRIRRLGLTH